MKFQGFYSANFQTIVQELERITHFHIKKLYDLKTKQEALKSESDHQYSYI